MEKNNKGIVTLLVVFIFTTLVLGGYLVYDKVLSKDNVNDNTNVEDNVITNVDTNLDVFVALIGKYEHTHTNSVDGVPVEECKTFTELEIRNDGTAKHFGGQTCGGAFTSEGKYAITDSKIYIMNDNCKVIKKDDTCEFPNCRQIVELSYTYNDGKLTIFDNGNELTKK